VPTEEWNNVRSALGQWQAVPGTGIQFMEGSPIVSTRQIPVEDGRVDVVWVDPGISSLASGFNGYQISLAAGKVAATWLFTDNLATSEIVQAIILVRRDLDFTTQYSESSATKPFLETVLLHELGHVLGLSHSPLATSTLWWSSSAAVNATTGLSADEIAFAQNVYGTATTVAGLGKISGTIRMNGSPVLGAMVLAERTNGVLVSATVSRANGGYELGGLSPDTYRVRVHPLDPNGGSDTFLVRGLDLDVTGLGEYDLAQTGFQSTVPVSIILSKKTVQTRDFALIAPAEAPRRITEIRRGLDRNDRLSGDVAIQLAPGIRDAWVGVYIPNLAAGSATLRVSGVGLSYGTTEILPGALRQLTLVQVSVTVDPKAAAGPRTLEVEVGATVIRANGFVEILPSYPDDNFDGFNDLFQRKFWNPFTVIDSGPEMDPDRDGYTNQRELAGSTDPISVDSYPLKLSVTREGSRLGISANVGIGKTYQLYRRDDLGGAWQASGVPRLAIAESLVWLDDISVSKARFYSVRREP